MDTDYTRRLIQVQDSLNDSLSSLAFCGDVDKFFAKFAGKNDPAFIEALPGIYKMSEFFGISNVEKDREPDYYKKLMKDATFGENPGGINDRVLTEMTKKLFELFSEYPEPKKYIERVVINLGVPEDNDEWASDSLRLKILKQFIKYGNSLVYEKSDTGETEPVICSVSGIKGYVKEVNKLKGDMNDEILLANIDDSVFEFDSLTFIKREKNEKGEFSKTGEMEFLNFAKIKETLDKQKKNVRKESDNPKAKVTDAELVKLIPLVFFKDGSSMVYEIIDRDAEGKALVDENGHTKKKLAEEFTSYDDFIAYAKTNGNIDPNAELTDEQILELIKDVFFKGNKKKLPAYDLLRSISEFAEGNFHTGGATKKMIYLFGMVYGMCFYTVPESELEPDQKLRSIEKFMNDFYTMNLIRYYDDSFNNNVVKYEIDPAGGINFKNYAEMVYCYFLARDPKEMSPAEKIRKSDEMIKRLKSDETIARLKETRITVGNEFRPSEEDDDMTRILKENVFFGEKVIDNYSEEKFEKYLEENYYTDVVRQFVSKKNGETKTVNVKVGVLDIEATQFSAYIEYCGLMDELDIDRLKKSKKLTYEQKKLMENKIDTLKNSRFILLETESYLNDYYSTKPIDDKKRFYRVLEAFNERLKEVFSGNINESNMSRAKLLSAFYYKYLLENVKHSEKHIIPMKTLGEVFNTIKKNTNDPLTDSGYPVLGSKNFFDILLAVAIYIFLYY